MDALAGRRALAYSRDCAGYALVAAAEVPLGLLLRRSGVVSTPRRTWWATASLPVLAAVIAARAESGPGHATPGKRWQGLAVVTTDGLPVGAGRALLRNLVKIVLPWQLGHTVALAAARGGLSSRDPLAVGSAVAVYALLGATVVSGAVRGGRTLHDRTAGTRVVSVST